jgi:hypothetical protein
LQKNKEATDKEPIGSVELFLPELLLSMFMCWPMKGGLPNPEMLQQSGAQLRLISLR